MAVSPFRLPGAVTGVAGPGGAAVVPGRQVSAMPAVGSPLMAQLVKFIQRANPAVAVTPENVGQYASGAFNVEGPAGGLPQMEKLWDALKAAGLARFQGGIRPSAGMARDVGANARYAMPSGANMEAFRMAPAPQVVVSTLPGSSPGGVQPAPIAQTPVGPMLYPPGPSPMGAVDPEPPFGTPAWFAWKYGQSTRAERLAQMRRNLAR